MDSSGNAAADFGRFLTGFLVLMGIGKFTRNCQRWARRHYRIAFRNGYCRSDPRDLPLESSCLLISSIITYANPCTAALPAVLAHSGAIEVPAMIMSILGGLLIYGTIISFSMFFQEQEEF